GSCGRYPTGPVLVIVPLAGCASPDRILVNVVLPAPLRPTRPILSPGATWNQACSRRRRAPARPSTSLATSIGLTLSYDVQRPRIGCFGLPVGSGPGAAVERPRLL